MPIEKRRFNYLKVGREYFEINKYLIDMGNDEVYILSISVNKEIPVI